jgi:integrase
MRLSSDRSEACRKWAALQADDMPIETVGDLIRRYMLEVAPAKAPSTYRGNVVESQALLKVFGKMDARAVRPEHVARFLDLRGQKAKVRANRECALLSHVFAKAMRWGVLTANPCRGVQKHTEKPRTRYITDDELERCKALAGEPIATMMEFAYLTAMRQGDMLALTEANMTDEGIAHAQSKTGKRLLIEWTPELRAVVERAKAVRTTLRARTSTCLFPTRQGARLKESGLRSIWMRIQRAWGEAGNERFHWHDIRAKALTDADRQGLNAQALAGHASRAMTERYIKAREFERVSALRRTPPKPGEAPVSAPASAVILDIASDIGQRETARRALPN